MIKRKLMSSIIILVFSGFLTCTYAGGFYTQSLSIGGETEENSASGNIQTFKTEEFPVFSNNESQNNNFIQDAQNYNEVQYYNPYYYPYPVNVNTYRIGVPYYSYGIPGYTITQPVNTGNFSFDYTGHGLDFGFSSGRPLYTPNYRPPQPPPPPPLNNHQPTNKPNYPNQPHNHHGNDGGNYNNNHFQSGRH